MNCNITHAKEVSNISLMNTLVVENYLVMCEPLCNSELSEKQV
jgi:hypothetical protein